MADLATIQTIENGPQRLIMHFTNVYVDTGESAAIKVDKSTYTVKNALGQDVEPSKLAIEAIRWNVQGYTHVRILFDHTADDLVMTVAGSGQEDFVNGGPSDFSGTQGLVDPASAGGTGDIVFTTAGTTAGNTYDITLWLRKVV